MKKQLKEREKIFKKEKRLINKREEKKNLESECQLSQERLRGKKWTFFKLNQERFISYIFK